MVKVNRCLGYNKKRKRCRTRISDKNNNFCCSGHKPPNYEIIKECCYICSDNVKIEDMIVLKCNHIHHIKCLVEWFNITHERGEDLQCPLCRLILYSGDVDKKIKKEKFMYYKI